LAFHKIVKDGVNIFRCWYV